MKRLNDMKTQMKPVAAAVALTLAAGPAAATEFWLCAKPTTLTMPDGTLVPMWGYVEDDDFDLTNGCLTEAQIPGPTLEVTDGALTIHLRNDLPEPTSLVIPGQSLPVVNGSTSVPTWVDVDGNNPSNTRTAPDSGQRVRSFVTEVDPAATADYVWAGLNGNATLLYHSATRPQVQVYMGLGGLVTNDYLPGQLYANVETGYLNSVELFFSDIDPAFNDAVVGGTLTTAINRHPTYFLINGEPYEAGVTADITNGTSGPLARGQETLLRLASTATDTHVAVLQGLNMTIHGEDGLQYNYQEWQDVETPAGSGTFVPTLVPTPAPRVQYSAMLPPSKTKDAIVVVPSHNPETVDSERYAVYDGNGYLTNPSDPSTANSGDTVGGMLRFLSFAPSGNNPPVAVDDSATTDEDVAVVIDVLTNDTDTELDPLTVSIASDPANGSVAVNGDNTVTYTPDPDFNGIDTFTYVANDGTVDSDPATVTVTVSPVNDAPVAADDAYSTAQDAVLNVAAVGVLANDTDVDVGDVLMVSQVNGATANVGVATATTAGGSVTLNADGSFAYTPPAAYTGPDSFTYVANDGTVDGNTATVIITVNTPPVANDDAAATNEDVPVDIAVLANDTDGDGDALTVTGVSDPANGSVVVNGDNTVTYTPDPNYNGVDTFTYMANDGTVDSAPATVTVTVAAVNDAPVVDAVADQAGTDGDVIAGLQIIASDPDVGDTLTYSATNLPPDLTIDSATGLISGTIAAAASTGSPYAVQVDVTDGNAATTSVTFTWTVNEVVTVTTQLYFSTVGAGSVPGVAGPYDDADVYTLDSTSAFARLYDATSAPPAGLDLPNNANIDGLSINGTTIYVSFAGSNTNVPGINGVQDEDVMAYDTTTNTWSTYFDGSVCGLDGSNGQDVDAISVSGGTLYFSTLTGGNRNPVAGADGNAATIYQWSGGPACSVALDAGTAGLPADANVDGLTVAGTTYYMSFTDATNVPLVGVVQDESVVVYDSGTSSWSPAAYFSGTGQLDGTDSQDVDAFQVP